MKIFIGKCSEAVDIYKKILANQYREEEPAAGEENQAPGKMKNQAGKTWKEQLVVSENQVDYGGKEAEIIDFAVVDHKGMITSSLDKRETFQIRMKVLFHREIDHPIFAYTIKDRKGTELTGTNTVLEDCSLERAAKGQEVVVCFEQKMNLQSGQYLLSLGCTGYEMDQLVIYHRIYDACFMEVFSTKDTVGYFDMEAKVFYDR